MPIVETSTIVGKREENVVQIDVPVATIPIHVKFFASELVVFHEMISHCGHRATSKIADGEGLVHSRFIEISSNRKSMG